MERHCPVCEKSFDTPDYNAARGKGLYCSKGCATKARWGNQTMEDRFWSKVDKGDADGCWIWIGGHQYGGYGSFRLRGRSHTASRVAYEITYGLPPENMYVCHRCDNPTCVRPDHLFLGTVTDNNRDMVSKHRDMHHTCPEKRAKGERQHLAKLNADQVKEIREAFTGKRGDLGILSKKYGVTKTAIAYVILRKTWKHI